MSPGPRREEGALHAAVRAIGYVNLVAYVALGVLSFVLWRRRRDVAAGWAAATFGVLAVVVLLGQVVPTKPHGFAELAEQRIAVALLVLFPYFLFRFTTAFRPSPRTLYAVVSATTATLVVWTFALPSFPQPDEPRPGWFWAYLVAFVVHWAILSVASAWRLWSGGRRQPHVARRRMQMLALAAAAITLAIVLAAASTGNDDPLALATGLLAFVSALAFIAALSPPAALRLMWRRPEQRRLQQAIESLMTVAANEHEIAERVLAPMAEIVGARAVAIRNVDGALVASHNVPPEAEAELAGGGEPPRMWSNAQAIDVRVPAGSLVVWTSPYAPFFGDEELRLLRSLGALTGLALDRARLFAGERETRVALERANELKANFVALAAHELRAPVTAIHGSVQTLRRLRERLTPQQKEDVERALEEQTERLARLVEQLLDLTRLEAEAIEISPERIDLRSHVEEIVGAVGADRGAVDIEIAADAVAEIDPNALDRIVSNLITNALRYGEPPVVVRAQRTDRHVRLSVEDRGHGVPAEFVPVLFERFSRERSARGRAIGSGLGLAIARQYARAHGGDLLYADASPHGASFQLVLPAEPRSGPPA